VSLLLDYLITLRRLIGEIIFYFAPPSLHIFVGWYGACSTSFSGVFGCITARRHGRFVSESDYFSFGGGALCRCCGSSSTSSLNKPALRLAASAGSSVNYVDVEFTGGGYTWTNLR
jgi:hypothetical protein